MVHYNRRRNHAHVYPTWIVFTFVIKIDYEDVFSVDALKLDTERVNFAIVGICYYFVFETEYPKLYRR